VADAGDLAAAIAAVNSLSANGFTNYEAGPVNDPLYAKALVLMDDARTVVLVTVDAVAIEEIGHKVASALIGTFLGIFFSYGYVQPLATNLELQVAAKGRFLLCIKNCLVAFARGAPPLVAVEVARHVMFSEDRPDSEALAEACRTAGKATK